MNIDLTKLVIGNEDEIVIDELMAIDGIFKEMYDKQQLEKQLSAE